MKELFEGGKMNLRKSQLPYGNSLTVAKGIACLVLRDAVKSGGAFVKGYIDKEDHSFDEPYSSVLGLQPGEEMEFMFFRTKFELERNSYDVIAVRRIHDDGNGFESVVIERPDAGVEIVEIGLNSNPGADNGLITFKKELMRRWQVRISFDSEGRVVYEDLSDSGSVLFRPRSSEQDVNDDRVKRIVSSFRGQVERGLVNWV